MPLRSDQAVVLIAAAFLSLTNATPLTAADADQLQVPAGFVVTQYADDRLAHDVFSMTIDSLGRIVVSGPGYVRILIDDNHDGVAESAMQFADGPATGAQGMFFVGRDLYCTGDGGLIRFRDADHNDRADGPPEVILPLKTGGEHFAHAVQLGPDGWWYVIVGNQAGVPKTDINLETSPLREAQAGTLIRFKPGRPGREFFADGMRNAYDFAFNAAGDLFVFDSDAEREVSLPAYRPIRVLHTLPGSNAGWVSGSWIRPDHYLDMPTVITSFGRGSPTGVVCYRHTQFPAEYRGALFVLDWSFGRVMAVPLAQHGGSWTSSNSRVFMTGKGPFGFAPTDVEVGPDGSLYVSIGGRGTQGGVFRISYRGTAIPKSPPHSAADNDRLSLCLAALQPLSSWSRARWMPAAQSLGREAFESAAEDRARPEAERVRALEIITELFEGIDERSLAKFASDPSPAVRARAVWSAGRSERKFGANSFRPFVEDANAAVARAALEALWSVRISDSLDPLLPSIVRRLANDDRTIRFAAARLIGRLDDAQTAVAVRLIEQPRRAKFSPTPEREILRARLWFAFGRCEHAKKLNFSALNTAVEVFERIDLGDLRLDALRVIQIALGDCVSDRKTVPVFHGYSSGLDSETARTQT